VLIRENYSLQRRNTFHVAASTRWFCEYNTEEELCRFLRDEYFMECRSLHIGEGSNLLFINDFNGIVLHSCIKGVEVVDDNGTEVIVRVGAGEKWDKVVDFAVAHGLGGIENLSAIPGETGAAAVQNIGAYGAEIKDVVASVEAYNQLSAEKRIFNPKECRYSYRHSFFKEPDNEPYIVTYVNLRLQKTPVLNIDYGNLKEALSGQEPTVQSVREAVIEVRRSKLPDTDVLGNAGSFFINPVVSVDALENLKAVYPDIPSFVVSEGKVKLSAGWLIEKCGLKGKRSGKVGIYDRQALVIVNYGGATGDEIAAFAEQVIDTVAEKFNLRLVPEVKFVQ
jgi:UDP-N-acetylmuramate dehydrogenase